MLNDNLETRIEDVEISLNKNLKTLNKIMIMTMTLIIGILIQLNILSYNIYYIERPINRTTICDCANCLDNIIDDVVNRTTNMYDTHLSTIFM